ncbi:MAG: DHH family phosphoesterase [Candidatus Nealsonbacteria bacterium]|nr:MAG: DHH family phosphoesterase [Candidatus Nealsonbacteria bacterium]
MAIKNLKKVAGRIFKAIKNKERIILYGDADLDGATSVIILEETIKNLGGNISAIYFPDREKEGYGITKNGLDYLKKFQPALLIALDCGIGNFKEIKLAKKMKFRVIVIDHHKILDKLPEADIIVDPKQKGDKYPFKELATAGIVFKLSELLLKEKMSQSLRKNFLELVALATMADMMPKVNDNKLFIEEGLGYMESSWRPGIKTLFEADFLKNFNLYEKVSKIISMLNVRDVENKIPTSFLILTTSSSQKLAEMIQRLREKNKLRKERVKEIIQELEERIFKSKELIIFEGDSLWEYPLISSVASIVCRDFGKPTFIFKKLKEESQGTVRVPSNIDSVSLMGKCKKYLITYGGHAKASGFRIKNENLEKFKSCLIKNL